MNRKLISTLAFFILIGLTACTGSATPETAAPQTPLETEAPTQSTPQPTAVETAAATEAAVPVLEASATAEATSNTVQTVSYAAQVVPIFETSCIKCHGVESRKEGLDMLTYDNLMAGSRNGPVLTPGNAADSLLVQLVESGDMPNRGPGLSPEQIQIIKDWVDQGALNN